MIWQTVKPKHLVSCLIVAAWLTAVDVRADQRVLMIGIDGAGGSFTQTANTPNLDGLAAGGAARYDWLNEAALFANPPNSYGASGVNWSTIATGASTSNHGAVDNSFVGNNFANVPHFFKFLKDFDSNLYTASIVNWAPINNEILDDQFADLELQGINDELVKDAAVNLLQNGDPNAVFLHFDEVDGAGHSNGWGSAAYLAQIENVDGLIGEVVTALNARPGVASGAEDWLVMVTADHGGAVGSLSHTADQGPINWQVPFVISGPSIPDGVGLEQGTLRDVATTALWHMGVDPFGTTVDGNVIAIPYDAAPANGIVGDLNQDGVVAGNGTGPNASDDVTAFVTGWLTSGYATAAEAYANGDLNLDRITDIADWIILNRLDPAMGQSALAALGRVPEPTTAALVGLSALTFCICRPRRSLITRTF